MEAASTYSALGIVGRQVFGADRMAGDTFCAQYEVIRVIEQGLRLCVVVFLSDDYALEDVEVFC